MKKPLAALLLSAATVAALAVPAGAATPPKPKKHLFAALPCTSAPHSKTARVWWAPTSGWIASNPCNLWLVVGYADPSGGGSGASVVNIDPHVYNARWRIGGPQVRAFVSPKPEHCAPGGSFEIGKDGKLRNISSSDGC